MDMESLPSAGLDRLELLQVADAVAREKSIERDEVLEAMEQAIQKAARSKYGLEHDVRAYIDRKSGDIKLARYLEVVEEIENEITQLTLEEARRKKPDAELGEFLVDPLPPIDFGRIAAQTAKQVIVQKVREAERNAAVRGVQGPHRPRSSTASVKRVEFGNVMVDLGRAEAVLRREELIPRENRSAQGDRVRAYIYDVRSGAARPADLLVANPARSSWPSSSPRKCRRSTTSIIEIQVRSRAIPAARAKIAVMTNDSSASIQWAPASACAAARVQAVVGELQGEKIDIIQWNPDPATFIVNALAPAEVAKVVLDEDQRKIEVVVPDDQLSLAIGRRGQNVRLASQLTQWEIAILTEDEESERRQEEFRSRSQMFIDSLDVEDVLAHLLVTEGFTSVEEVAFVPIRELLAIEGFDEELAEELRARAQVFLTEEEERQTALRRELGVTDELATMDGISAAMAVTLGEAGIKTVDDLGDLSTDEMINVEDGVLREYGLSSEEAEAMIMAARAHWFDDEEMPEAEDDSAMETQAADGQGETADPMS